MEIIGRRAAHEKGLAHYYTGNACKYGHVAQRLVASGACLQCARQYSRTYARVQNGATLRVMFENVHPEDAAVLRDTFAALQAARDAAGAAHAPDIDGKRAQTFPDLTTAPPGYAPPPFTPHPGGKP